MKKNIFKLLILTLVCITGVTQIAAVTHYYYIPGSKDDMEKYLDICRKIMSKKYTECKDNIEACSVKATKANLCFNSLPSLRDHRVISRIPGSSEKLVKKWKKDIDKIIEQFTESDDHLLLLEAMANAKYNYSRNRVIICSLVALGIGVGSGYLIPKLIPDKNLKKNSLQSKTTFVG